VTTSRPLCAAISALAISLGVAACGSSSPSSSTASAGAGANGPGARRGFLRDPKVVACLKQQGVTIPGGPRRGNGPPANGQKPPTGTNRRPPAGQGGPGSAQFQKLRAALQKCGVNFGGRPPNGRPPNGQGTTTGNAS
jgi:hypothetical protein